MSSCCAECIIQFSLHACLTSCTSCIFREYSSAFQFNSRLMPIQARGIEISFYMLFSNHLLLPHLCSTALLVSRLNPLEGLSANCIAKKKSILLNGDDFLQCGYHLLLV